MTNTEPPAAIEKNNTSSNNVNETPISIMIMPSAGYSFGYLVIWFSLPQALHIF